MYNYTCQLTLMGATTDVTADWYNNTDNTANISCVIEQNVIPIDVTGSVQVIWGESYRLRQDNELSCEYIHILTPLVTTFMSIYTF